jgi:hypothetical protein
VRGADELRQLGARHHTSGADVPALGDHGHDRLGDVQLSWAGTVSQVQFTYRAGITGASVNQHIGIGNISFSDCVANP